MIFSAKLLIWASQHSRPMPWKGETDPYKIWLSEIILQQTRVEQGLPYYERFVENYRTVTDLADAPADDVMRLWQGLGYYSRARNLQTAAQYIRDVFQGVFPQNYDDIRALKGVGDYTAAAIASFAYNLPFAVVDGNVYRVLSRIFGVFTPIDSSQGKKEFAILAQNLLDKSQAALYNQAIIDFGATHCTPQNPKCSDCPFQKDCQAYIIDEKTNRDSIRLLPVKSKKMAIKHRFFHYFYFGENQKIWIQKRTEKDIWQDLWQLPLHETARDFAKFKIFISPKNIKENHTKKGQITQIALFDPKTPKKSREKKYIKLFKKDRLKIKKAAILVRKKYGKIDFLQQILAQNAFVFDKIIEKTQQLTHQKIHCRFYILKKDITVNLAASQDFQLEKKADLTNFGFPKSIVSFLEENS